MGLGAVFTGVIQSLAHGAGKWKHRCAAFAPRGELLVPNRKWRRREQLREVMRFKHYSWRTEETYWGWIRQFLEWPGTRRGSSPARAGSAGQPGSTESHPTLKDSSAAPPYDDGPAACHRSGVAVLSAPRPPGEDALDLRDLNPAR